MKIAQEIYKNRKKKKLMHDKNISGFDLVISRYDIKIYYTVRSCLKTNLKGIRLVLLGFDLSKMQPEN